MSQSITKVHTEHSWRTLVAGKGLGDDARNDAVGRPVVAAREGRPSEERESVRGGGSRDKPER